MPFSNPDCDYLLQSALKRCTVADASAGAPSPTSRADRPILICSLVGVFTGRRGFRIPIFLPLLKPLTFFADPVSRRESSHPASPRRR